LARTIQEGTAHAQELVRHAEGIEERVEKLAENAVATAAVIRNAFWREWMLLKSCLRTAKKFVELAEKLSAVIHAAMGKGLVDRVIALVTCLKKCFGAIPMFVTMVEQMREARSNLRRMFSAAHSFLRRLEAVTEGEVARLRHDAALVERDVQSALAEGLFCMHQGFATLTGCCQVAQAMEASEGKDALVERHGVCLAALEGFEGSTGTEEIESLRTSLVDAKDRLKALHDGFEDKLHRLERPPEGVWEWVTSPFVKTYQACDFGIEVAEDIAVIPSVWSEAKSSFRTASLLLQTTHDRMSHFWQSLAAMVSVLCERMWVAYNPQFEDPSIPDVHFDPAFGFLGWLEHWFLSSVRPQACIIGARRLSMQSMAVLRRQESRALRKWVVITAGKQE